MRLVSAAILPAVLPAALLAAAIPGLAAGQTASSTESAPGDAGTIMARMTTADGTDVGRVTFVPMRAGVLVEAELTGLTPGPHAIHIHEHGACTPDFTAAGGHLSPDGHEHGFAKTETPEMGDLPNLFAAADGTAHVQFLNWRLTPEALLDADGSAVIIHESEDTYMDPASAGGRLACGVVEHLS